MDFFEALPACVQQSRLLATAIDTRMPIHEREQWADKNFEQVDEKWDALLTISSVCSYSR